MGETEPTCTRLNGSCLYICADSIHLRTTRIKFTCMIETLNKLSEDYSLQVGFYLFGQLKFLLCPVWFAAANGNEINTIIN